MYFIDESAYYKTTKHHGAPREEGSWLGYIYNADREESVPENVKHDTRSRAKNECMDEVAIFITRSSSLTWRNIDYEIFARRLFIHVTKATTQIPEDICFLSYTA